MAEAPKEEKKVEGGFLGMLQGVDKWLEKVEKTGNSWYEYGGKTEDGALGLMNAAFNGIDGAVRTILHTPYYFAFLPAYLLWEVSWDNVYRTAAMAGLVTAGLLPFVGPGGAILAGSTVVLGKLLENETTRKPTIAALLAGTGFYSAGLLAPELTAIFGSPLVMGAEGAVWGGLWGQRRALDWKTGMANVNKALNLKNPDTKPAPSAIPGVQPAGADTATAEQHFEDVQGLGHDAEDAPEGESDEDE